MDELTAAERFFYEHAGSSYDPKTETAEQGRVRGAKALARAEAVARDVGWSITWMADESFDWSDVPDGAEPGQCPCCLDELDSYGRCDRLHEALACVVDAGGDDHAALSGIVDPDATYARVVEAELCSEVLAAIEQRAANDAAAQRYMVL